MFGFTYSACLVQFKSIAILVYLTVLFLVLPERDKSQPLYIFLQA